MTDHGLEWLGRLSRHPIRHFKRYVIGLPILTGRALATRLRRGRDG
jgi:UDP-N-acetyl-D-mannosaminuronic acid transferase (WecB/TagA/CpsF family)